MSTLLISISVRTSLEDELEIGNIDKIDIVFSAVSGKEGKSRSTEIEEFIEAVSTEGRERVVEFFDVIDELDAFWVDIAGVLVIVIVLITGWTIVVCVELLIGVVEAFWFPPSEPTELLCLNGDFAGAFGLSVFEVCGEKEEESP